MSKVKEKHALVILSLILSLIFFCGCSQIKVERPVVAELTDSVDAVWESSLQIPDEYDNTMILGRYRLNEGYATILFIEGTSVIIEAPAELSLNSSSDMELFRGKMFAVVPDKAVGFTVDTNNSKIVDLGTEFGIEVDDHGNTQLHVIKGKTMLFANFRSGGKPERVVAGAAKKISKNGLVSDIPLDNNKFARKIDTKKGAVIRK